MILRVGALALLWVALYGEVSVGNVVGGLAVALVLVLMFPIAHTSVRRVRLLGSLKLAGYVFVNLVLSTWRVVLAVLFPRPERTEATIRDVAVSTRSATAMTLMGNLITLTPGTMTVDVDPSSGVLRVHVLGRVDPDDFRRDMENLEQRVLGALVLESAK